MIPAQSQGSQLSQAPRTAEATWSPGGQSCVAHLYPHGKVGLFGFGPLVKGMDVSEQRG